MGDEFCSIGDNGTQGFEPQEHKPRGVASSA